jgi:hypothetical protein
VTAQGVVALASQLLRRAFATCACAARPWKLDVSRNFAGVTVRAEVRSR